MALVAFLLAVPAAIVATALLAKRAARYYRTDGATIEVYPNHDEPFVVEVPAGGPCWVMIRYGVGLRRRLGSRATYGLTIVITAERATEGGGERRVETYQRQLGYDAPRPRGIPVAPGEPAYAVDKAGIHETRTSVIARLPAGGPGKVSGTITVGGGTTLESLCVFVKPPPGAKEA